MNPITGYLAAQAVQGVRSALSDTTAPATDAEATGSEVEVTSFEDFMRSAISAEQGNIVNEEELFAALIEERIASLKGEEAAGQFREALEEEKASMRRGDGYIPVEDAANAALERMTSRGVLTEPEAATVRDQSFAAAQLDDDHSVLYDGRGSGEDPTIATGELESALAAARALIEKFDSGTTEASPVEDGADVVVDDSDKSSVVDEADSADKADGVKEKQDMGDGFLWKPESESTGNLVILLPPDLANEVQSLQLRDEDDKVVAKGQSTGYANGGREHFRFDKAGEDYPDNLTVEVKMKDGSIKTWAIGDTSERHEQKLCEDCVKP